MRVCKLQFDINIQISYSCYIFFRILILLLNEIILIICYRLRKRLFSDFVSDNRLFSHSCRELSKYLKKGYFVKLKT